MLNKRYLILGKNGMLGQDLQKVFHDRDFVTLGSTELDIRDEEAVKAILLNVQPDVVINATAYTNVNEAEKNLELAKEINGYAVGKLAKICRDFGVLLVHFSSDYVFNGQKKDGYREDDLPDPVNEYGISKLLGEQLLQDEMEMDLGGDNNDEGKFFLIRTSYLIGHGRANLVSKLLDKAKAGVPFKVIEDQFSKVTFCLDLASQVKWLIESGEYESGIYHITNSGVTNWLEFARTLLHDSGLNFELAVPCLASEWISPVKRPQFSVLVNTKLPELRHWKEALKDYLST